MSEEHSFTTSSGITVRLKSVPPLLLQRIAGSLKAPEKPTYTVKTVAGDVEVHEHDELSVQGDAEAEAAWKEYQEAERAYQIELSRRLTNAILLRGVEVEVPASGWQEEQELLGIEVPAEPARRRLHYLETEVLGSPDDITSIILEVMRQSGLDDERVREAEALFLRGLQGAAGNSG